MSRYYVTAYNHSLTFRSAKAEAFSDTRRALTKKPLTVKIGVDTAEDEQNRGRTKLLTYLNIPTPTNRLNTYKKES